MIDIDKIKLLGGFGSILIILSFFPYIGFILALIGFFLVGIAFKQIFELKQEEYMFKEFILGAVIGFVAILIMILGFKIVISVFGIANSSILAKLFSVILYISGWGLLIISANFLKKIYYYLSKIFRTDAFKKAGELIYIGAILSIIPFFAVIILIGFLFAAVGFFSIRTVNSQIHSNLLEL